LSDEIKTAIATLSQAEKDCELQGHICGCIQIITNRLRDASFDLTSRAERLMTLYMHVFQLYQRLQQSQISVHEEALLATSSLALNLGAKFSHFMPTFFSILLAALSNADQYAVCSMAVGVVGDLSRAIDVEISQYCDKLVRESLAPLLERKDVDRRLKPLVMTALGDLALATRGQFEPYVPGTIKLLTQASFTRLEDGPVDSEEWIDYLNQLRMAVLEGYIGLVYGLREANRHMVLKDNVQSILEFIVRLIDDKSVSEDVVRKAMDLVGDLVISYQADLARLLKDAPFMQRLITFAATSKDTQTQETGKWLARIVDKYN
jgi:importin subunit beta-1